MLRRRGMNDPRSGESQNTHGPHHADSRGEALLYPVSARALGDLLPCRDGSWPRHRQQEDIAFNEDQPGEQWRVYFSLLDNQCQANEGNLMQKKTARISTRTAVPFNEYVHGGSIVAIFERPRSSQGGMTAAMLTRSPKFAEAQVVAKDDARLIAKMSSTCRRIGHDEGWPGSAGEMDGVARHRPVHETGGLNPHRGHRAPSDARKSSPLRLTP
jgi:hypothetical protein